MLHRVNYSKLFKKILLGVIFEIEMVSQNEVQHFMKPPITSITKQKHYIKFSKKYSSMLSISFKIL